MKEAAIEIIKNIANLIDVKTIVTLGLTLTLILILTGKFTPSDTAFDVFKIVYTAVITYFFTKATTTSSGSDTTQK